MQPGAGAAPPSHSAIKGASHGNASCSTLLLKPTANHRQVSKDRERQDTFSAILTALGRDKETVPPARILHEWGSKNG